MRTVFISHASKDAGFVARLRESLPKTYAVIDAGCMPALSGGIMESISESISSADIFIALVSDGSPYVMLETGMAIGMGKKILIVSTTGADVPADLASLPFVNVDLDDEGAAYPIVAALRSLAEIPKPVGKKFAPPSLRDVADNPALIDALDHSVFERTVADWFARSGFEVSEQARPGQWHAFDFVACRPETGKKIGVDVKKYRSSSLVPVDAVRKAIFAAIQSNIDEVVIVSASDFTKSAHAFSREMSPLPILLVKVDQLVDMEI